MFGKYKIAHLLGITRDHEEQFRHVERELTKDGFICFAPAIYDFDVYKENVALIDDMCYEKLLVCDFCVVVTPEHIGESTTKRISQAISLGKPVYKWEDDRLKKLIYETNKEHQAENKKDEIPEINIPADVRSILEKINTSGYEAVIVGGCVRDSIMGIKPHDYDIATSALPEEIMKIFDGEKTVLTGLKHGTVTVVRNHIPYEITTYRIDSEYSDHRRPDKVEFTSDLKKDLSRRDFTMNAIAFDGENIFDYFNGVADIKNKIVRCVGRAEDRIKEDPLRILRAIRFSSSFNFSIDEETSEAIKKSAKMLGLIAQERKTSELNKILTSKYAKRALLEYHNVFTEVIPRLSTITIKDWQITVDKMSGKTLDECIAILVDELYGNFSLVETKVTNFCYIMRYPNNIRNNVIQILNCQKEILYNDPVCARKLLSKYSLNNIIFALRCKKEKISHISTLQCEKDRLLYIVNELINTVSFIFNERANECYLIEHLNVNGNDLKAMGLKDKEIGEWLHRLLALVCENVIENDRDSLLDFVQLNII